MPKQARLSLLGPSSTITPSSSYSAPNQPASQESPDIQVSCTEMNRCRLLAGIVTIMHAYIVHSMECNVVFWCNEQSIIDTLF